jgi:hypothetical protein
MGQTRRTARYLQHTIFVFCKSADKFTGSNSLQIFQASLCRSDNASLEFKDSLTKVAYKMGAGTVKKGKEIRED